MSVNRFNLNEFLNQFSFANSLSSDLLQKSLSSKPVSLLNDYENFQGHIFFGNATRKSTVVINEIIDHYPIGISGSATSSLSADKVAEFENWSLSADGFTKFALNFICGATATFLAPTITSSASSYNSDFVVLNVLERNTSNNVLNTNCATNINNLLEAATLFDEGIARTKLTSGTGSEQFVIPTFDDEIVDYVVPEKIRTSVNRNMSLEKYMTHQTPFFIKDDEVEVFQRLICVIADFFDSIKEYVDQFSNIYNFQYSGYDRSPEGLTQYLAAKQFGLELFEGAIAGNLPEYYIQSGKKGLQKITYEIWNRILNDVSSLYKGKGTKFAFTQLIRDFGFYEGFISVREYIDHLETGDSTYEKNLNVKVPQFGVSGFNVFKISTSSITSSNVGTVMFSVYMPNIEDYVGGDFQIANIFNNRFVYDSTNRKYKIYPALPSITSSFDVWSSENDVTLVNGYLSTQLTPFIVSVSGYGSPSSANSTAIINIETLNSLSGSFTTSAASAYSGLTLSSLNFASNTGNYFLANTKLFTRRITTNEYLRNQHARLLESNLVADFKLYDVPTVTALNSYLGSLTSPIVGVTGSLTGGTSSYDILPINFKRDWQSTGIMNMGGDFIVEDDLKRTGSNNLGIGLFSSEAINNDILDYYTSSSATNITSFYLDPQIYYGESSDKRKWTNLEEHRKNILGQTRYPGGIKYEKFIKLIYSYRFILSNFFNTMDQFLRFKSRIAQKGVNIEASFLERDRHSISSDFISETSTFSPIPNFVLSAENINSVSSTFASITGINQTSGSSETFSLTTQQISAIHQVNEYNSYLPAYNFSGSAFLHGSLSISGHGTLSASSYAFVRQGTTGTQIDEIGYKGVSTSRYTTNISLSSDSISSIISANKKVLETSESIFIPLTGSIQVVYFPTSTFIGIGNVLTVNFNRNSYVSGIKIYSSFTDTNTASHSAINYFISTYNGTIPISGTLSASTISSSSVVGLFQATMLEDNFKDIGIDTEQGYFRRFSKINLKIQSGNSSIKCRNNVFEINNPIDPASNLPIFNFYCYNNNKYYTQNSFSVPTFSKNGTDLLVSVNSIFNNINKGKQTIKFLNLLNSESKELEFDVINNANEFTDSTFTQFTNDATTNIVSSVTSDFQLNAQSITLSAGNISSSSLVFGVSEINYDRGLLVFLNGTQQDENVFWNYTFSGGTNNLNFNSSSLTSGDIISLFFNY